MRRNLTFYKLANNGQRWFVTCAEWGPYTNVDEAMAKAERLNQQQTAEQKKRSRAVVMEWRKRKLGGNVQ